VPFTNPTNRRMHSHSTQNDLQTVPLLPSLGAGQMVCVHLIVTEVHNGGIALHRLKITPAFVKGMRFRKLVPSLHSNAVITARCLARQNVQLRLPENREESIGSVKLDSHKRFRHVTIDMIRQKQL